MATVNRLPEELTPREIQVLKLIATGLSTKAIASSLGITFKTAACHRSRITAKLGVHGVANLTRYALRRGFVELTGANQQRDAQRELFDRVTATETVYRRALDDYAGFIRERETIGLASPDGVTGARKLRQAEELAHEQYHAALVALKDFLVGH